MKSEEANQNMEYEKKSGNTDPKIAAIREIIFGDNIKEFEKEFKKLNDIIDNYKAELEEQIDRYKKEAKALLEETNKDFEQQIVKLRQELNDKLNDLADKKLDRKSFGSALKKLSEEIIR